jgi:serine/threonine protein kinase
MGLWKDPASGVSRFVPDEAVIMLFLGKSNRFPTIDSVYTDDAFVTIVMSSALDGDPCMNEEMYTQYNTKYHVYSGASMVWEKETLLNEIEVCKIASQLVEALIYLRDMGMSHGDLSHRNYLLGENLDVSMFLERREERERRHANNSCVSSSGPTDRFRYRRYRSERRAVAHRALVEQPISRICPLS